MPLHAQPGYVARPKKPKAAPKAKPKSGLTRNATLKRSRDALETQAKAGQGRGNAKPKKAVLNGNGKTKQAKAGAVANGKGKSTAEGSQSATATASPKAKSGSKSGGRSVNITKEFFKLYPYAKRTVLQSSQSPLCCVDWSKIVSEPVFNECIGQEEAANLMAMLSPADVTVVEGGSGAPSHAGAEHAKSADPAGTLRRVLTSPVFQSALLNYQNLLQSGSFDSVLHSSRIRVVEHYNRLRVETDLTQWRNDGILTQGSRRSRLPGAEDLPEVLRAALCEINAGWTKEREGKCGSKEGG